MKTTTTQPVHSLRLALGIAALLAAPLEAATISVDSTADSIANDGACTLREAIINANANDQSGSTDCAAGSGSDVIELPAGTVTLALAGRAEDAALTGDLDITETDATGDLTITGAVDATGAPASVIDANGIDRIFDIFNPAQKVNTDAASSFDGVAVNLDNLRLINGVADEGLSVAAGNQGNGGAVFSWRFNSLTIDNCVFANNQAVWDTNIDDPGTADLDERTLSGHGGAVYSRGFLTIRDSRFDGNQAYTTSDANLDGTIEGEDEKSGNGGGVFTSYQTLIETSTFSDNVASNGGGLNTTGGFGSFAVRTSTFSGNQAVMGGGINNVSPQVNLQIENSTVSGNSASDMGAGINSDGYVRLAHVTVAANRLLNTDNKGAGINYFGPAGDFVLANTLLADNMGKSVEINCGCTGGVTLACSDLDVSSQGGNLSSDFSCGLNSAAGDFTGPDPQLLALADNGGPTQTHALDFDSVAIDAARDANCAGAGINTDQRGEARPRDGDGDGAAGCDIGAYERQPALTDLLITGIAPDADPVTLGDQVTFAISAGNTGPDTVTGAKVTVALPAELGFVAGAVAGGADCTLASSVVTCTLGDLGASASASMSIVTAADVAGTATVSATVSAVQIDSVDITNNTDEASITIDPAAVPAPAPASSDGGGGGCMLGTAGNDPLTAALALLAAAALALRRGRTGARG
jgi:uncharacterized repeat protein (TIGR01451 family)/CSLREA domain-containing protein